MMQQVNLLQAELVAKTEPLKSGHLALVWGTFTILLLAFTGWQGFDLVALKAQMTQTTQQLEALVLANHRTRRSQLAPEELRNRVTRLRAEQTSQDQLVALLRAEQVAGGFAVHLESLARAHVQGMWLQEIRLRQAAQLQVSLKGSATDPLQMPIFLQNLGAEPPFADHRFDQFNLTGQDGSQVIDFSIVSAEEPSA